MSFYSMGREIAQAVISFYSVMNGSCNLYAVSSAKDRLDSLISICRRRSLRIVKVIINKRMSGPGGYVKFHYVPTSWKYNTGWEDNHISAVVDFTDFGEMMKWLLSRKKLGIDHVEYDLYPAYLAGDDVMHTGIMCQYPGSQWRILAKYYLALHKEHIHQWEKYNGNKEFRGPAAVTPYNAELNKRFHQETVEEYQTKKGRQ